MHGVVRLLTAAVILSALVLLGLLALPFVLWLS